MSAQVSNGPLAGLRVLETATGIAGPYAGRVLAMLGATVAKLEPPGGDPARWQPVDDEPLTGLSPLFVHLNAAKRNVATVDLDWPQVIIDDRVRSEIDPAVLGASAALISITPWGLDGPRSGGIGDELLVQAESGFLGFNRDLDDAPLRLPGWPSQYQAGALGAVAALAARRGDYDHVDVSWLAAFMTSVELAYADALHCERPRSPVGAHPPTSFPSGAIPCADGYVTPGSIRAVDWEMQCLLYGRPDLIDNHEYAHRQNRANHLDELWEIITPWYAARTKREIFQEAIDTPWSVGMVLTPTDALVDEHLVDRAMMTGVVTPEGNGQVIGSLWKGDGLGVDGPLTVSAQGADPQPEMPPVGGPGDGGQLRALDGLTVIEMTVAWAGPYVGNILAPLGVDVVKLEAQNPFDGWRALRPYDHGMRPGQGAFVDDNRFFDSSGLYNALNKGKRGCVLSLAQEEGRAVFLDMVASADAIVANFSAHVLPSLGLDWATLEAVNPGLVVVRMPAFGTSGPYQDVAGYGSIVEAMGGIGHRQGYEREGARISNIYYPDPVAGVHAAVGLMAGLQRRDVTGRGGEIDLSHQEATWAFHGDALVLAAAEGRDVGRTGNRMPGVAVSDIVTCADGAWVAVVGDDGCASLVASAAEMTADAMIGAVRFAGGHAAIVLDPWSATSVAPVVDLLESVDHPVTGPVRHLVNPFVIDGVRPPARGAAPRFDEHTDAVVADLAGYDADRIAELRAAGVIGGELPAPAALGLRFSPDP